MCSSDLVEKSRELKREISAFAEVLLSDEDLHVKKEQIKSNEATKDTLQKEVLVKTEELEHIKTREQTIKKELLELTKIKEHKQKVFSELELVQNTKSSEIMNQVKLHAELHELEHKQEEVNKLGNLKAEYASVQEQIKEQDKLREIQLKKDGLQKEQIS